MDSGRKRGRQDAGFSGNGGFKRAKEEMDSYTGVGSKSKPCTKFFSTSGCAFGDSCHFLHYIPGYNAHTQLANMGGHNAVPGRNVEFPDGPAPTMRTKMCNRINTPEGCRFGDKCHFAHSEMELGKSPAPGYEDPRSLGPMGGSSRWRESLPHGMSVGSFGASATAKISINSSLAGPIIGKHGANSKQICRQTGVKLSIRDHETDPNQRNIELEGTFDQIKEASAMVQQLIRSIGASTGRPEKPVSSFGRGGQQNHYKKRMCENFPNGLCAYGEKCHFAHSASELRLAD
ncbi:zinc finger CCCH domain-containing protein 14-like [Primulina huaijiensis]|uniref:zinc finger CCCH domain-containing protein 14-like n=1 Tax=Primulina huaijiensis TaxID=1492673 RepID=UPI003CC763D9